MDGETDLHTVPLSMLTYEARNLLSCLLNTTKILLSEGPDKLPRDWRGLASLINISSERANSYERDKTAEVLADWIKKQDGTATIGKLLEYVKRIDRYDIFDDFIDLSSRGRLVVDQQLPQNYEIAIRGCQAVALRSVDDIEDNLITFDDKIHGSPQFYHAYVLYAYEDRSFVEEMLRTMRERNFKLCTEEDILPDHASTYAAVSRLISSERCYRIILVYSPEFLTSSANKFYMDYAQAISIETKRPKIVPVMYRYCLLPSQVTFYHKLYYNPIDNKSTYDFWDKLGYSLAVTNVNSRQNLNYSSLSSLNITELTSRSNRTNGMSQQIQSPFLALPPADQSSRCVSMDNINENESSQSSGASANSDGQNIKKKKGFRDMFKFGTSKKRINGKKP